MKSKQLALAIAALSALAFTSCSGGSSSSGSGSGESMFGDLPSIYEKKELSFLREMKAAQEKNDTEAALKLFDKMENTFKEMGEEMQPKAEKMIGRSVAYSVSEGLPYRVVSDVKIEKVQLPTFGMRSKSLSINLAFDIIKDTDERNLYLYFFLMDGDKAVAYDRQSTGYSAAKGDTVHVTTSITAPDIPAKYQERCKLLKFVSDSTYHADRDAIREQQEQWSNEQKKKLGLD